MREENFQTTIGIDTPAAGILWVKLNDDHKSRLALLKLFYKYETILSGIENDYWYLSELVLDNYIARTKAAYNGEHYSYAENILKTLRKKHS